MGNVTINPILSLATASTLAIALYGASPSTEGKYSGNFQAAKYEAFSTSPSNENIKFSLVEQNTESLENRVSRYYASLASQQTELGHEFESAILSNLSDLYED